MPAHRVSNEEKALRGTLRQDRLKKPTVVIDGSSPKPSSWLSKEAKKEFKRVLQTLASSNQNYLTSIDMASLEAYAVSYAAWVDAEKTLQAQGSTVSKIVVNRSTGNVTASIEIPSPWLRISKDRLQSLLRSIAALGFDPRSRNAIDIPAPRPRRYTPSPSIPKNISLETFAKEHNL